MPGRSSAWWEDLIAALEKDLTGGTGPRDAHSWTQLQQEVHALAAPLYRRFGGDVPLDEDDLTQEVLLRLQSVRALRRLRAARSVEGYLVVMMTNHLRDQFRRSRLERLWERTLPPPAMQEPAPSEDLVTLKRVFARLSPEDRELLHMRFWRGLTIREIAAAYDEKHSTISARLIRLLRRLERSMTV